MLTDKICFGKLPKILFVTFIFVFLVSSDALTDNSILTKKDFLIVEIKDQDLELLGMDKGESEDEIRLRMRVLHSHFLDTFRNRARYLVLDFWYDDKGDKNIDSQLVESMKKTTNMTFAVGGIQDDELYLSLPQFTSAVKKVSHVFIRYHKKDGAIIESSININFFLHSKNFAVNIFLEQEIKHLSLVVLDALHIPYRAGRKIHLPAKAISRFRRIPYAYLLEYPYLADNKIIFLVSHLKDKEDIHNIPGFGEITGPELLCNIILYIIKKP
ncbi:MAG: hypothetical protein JW827_09005 [Spirochaetes bacterium]|nr:hypothetical protein [Spirochaetota bacterium]